MAILVGVAVDWGASGETKAEVTADSGWEAMTYSQVISLIVLAVIVVIIALIFNGWGGPGGGKRSKSRVIQGGKR